MTNISSKIQVVRNKKIVRFVIVLFIRCRKFTWQRSSIVAGAHRSLHRQYPNFYPVNKVIKRPVQNFVTPYEYLEICKNSLQSVKRWHCLRFRFKSTLHNQHCLQVISRCCCCMVRRNSYSSHTCEEFLIDETRRLDDV